MQFKTFNWLSQYTIIYKYGERTRQLKFKRELNSHECVSVKRNVVKEML